MKSRVLAVSLPVVVITELFHLQRGMGGDVKALPFVERITQGAPNLNSKHHFGASFLQPPS